jgi:hypothetical protein
MIIFVCYPGRHPLQADLPRAGICGPYRTKNNSKDVQKEMGFALGLPILRFGADGIISIHVNETYQRMQNTGMISQRVSHDFNGADCFLIAP